MRSLLAALVAMSASAFALKVSDCTAASGTTLTYDLSAKCYTGNFDTSGALDITINVPNTVDGKDIRLVLWNAAQSNSFTASVQYRDTTATNSAVAVTNARGTAASAATIPFTYVQTVTSARMGEHHIVVSGGAGAWAFVVDTMGDQAGMTTVGGSSNTMYSVLAGAAAPSATVNVRGGFVAERVMVKSVSVAVTPASSEAVARPSAGTFTPTTGTTINSASVTTSSGVSTLVFNRVSRPSATAASAAFTLGNVATTYYNWATNGPYFTGTVAIASSAVTAYPKIAASAASAMTITAAGRTLTDVDVVEIALDEHWWNVTINAPTTTAASYNAGPPNVYLAVDPTTDLFTSSNVVSLRPSPNANVGAALTYTNPLFAVAPSIGVTPATANALAPVTRETPPRAFLRIERRAGQPTTGLLTTSMTYTTMKLAGSCTSYADCYKSEEDHPALRYLLSGDSQATRLRRCLVIPSEADASVPVAQCSECTSDCDCGSGQYCHTDPGVCSGPNGEYVCDPDSNARFGLCVNKDPTGQILGGSCRSDSGTTFSATTALFTTPASSAIVANQLASTGETSSLITGYGFCGGVAYYNSSNTDGANSNGYSRRNVARKVLWSGNCLDGVCHECTTSQAQCGGAKTCIQGRVVETIVIDDTSRTFTSNVVAGTMLAATLMIVLALIVVLTDCVCRHAWRTEDVKQRKLNHERRHRKKAAADAETAQVAE